MKKAAVLSIIFMIFFVIACSNNSNRVSGENQDDSEKADEDQTDGDTEEEEDDLDCTGISVDWETFGLPAHSYIFDADLKTNIGDPDLTDVFELSFPPRDERINYSQGTFILGKGKNNNYSTCTECAVIFQDYVPYEDPEAHGAMGYWTKTFFQKSGTLTITDRDVFGEIRGTISVKLVEAAIDPETKLSTLIKDGECYEIESGNFDTGLCNPDCNGKVCGTNGCSGSCGSCGDLACSADQSACVPWECETIDGFEKFTHKYYEFASFPHFYESSVTGNALGDASIEDRMEIMFRKGTSLSVGTVKLKDHVGLCEQCIYLYEDDAEYEPAVKQYFQQSGELVFEKVDEETFDSKGHGSIRLIEYAEDSHYNLIPVSGGKCYEIPNLTWDTFCYPDCEGKICGDDGCGGTCGKGCGQDEYCNSEQTECLPYENCTKITLNNDENSGYIGYYYTSYTPNTGDPEESDKFTLHFYTELPFDSELEFDLYGIPYIDSDVRIFVYEDSEKSYFQQKGRIFVTIQKLEKIYKKITVEITDLRLVETETDHVNPPYETLIPGGSCLELEDATIEYVVREDD